MPRQIHLEERQSAKKSDEAKYREALEAARREVRGHFEASIEELKERHKLELQEGKTILFLVIFNTGVKYLIIHFIQKSV